MVSPAEGARRMKSKLNGQAEIERLGPEVEVDWRVEHDTSVNTGPDIV